MRFFFPAHGLLDIFQTYGIEARYVGGFVRDILLGISSTDVDIAVKAEPSKIIEILTYKGITVKPTGLSHGTVTAILDHHPIQITSLRQDVKTDGRRAEVVFGTSWEEDTKRRDFTINALYMDKEGKIYDYVGGQEDLQAGIIRFIGSPFQRIQEDYLRILRFFRFQAYYGRCSCDPLILDIITQLKEGLRHISKERIHQEWVKLLKAPDPRKSLKFMHQSSILMEIAPLDWYVKECILLIEKEKKFNISPFYLRRFYSFLGKQIKQTQSFFRFSKKDNNYLINILYLYENEFSDNEILYFFGKELYLDYCLITNKEIKNCLEKIKKWKKPSLPFSSYQLLEKGIYGEELGKILKGMEKMWVQNNFKNVDINSFLALRRQK